jgi:UDP-N-acetylmuramoyl-tripeptide--D-alanyl-D-alanine ligase
MVNQILINVILFFGVILLYKYTRHGIHMLQLESYFNSRYFKWLKKNLLSVFNISKIALLIIPVVLAFINQTLVGLILEIIAVLLLIITTKKKPEKKPLVVTARVKRMYATYIILYILVVVLANLLPVQYGLLILNSILILSYLMIIVVNVINSPVEKLIKQKFINQAKKKLKETPGLKVLGITGSYGKTSTKYALNSILSQRYNTLMTPESYNTTMGVVRTINEKLNSTHNLFICEMGAKNIGDIKEITDIVHPTYGMLTAIGPQHLDTFKSIENVAKTKMELLDSLPLNTGIAFVNWEDENIRKQKLDKKTIKFGLSKECDYYAKEISINERGSQFEVVMPNNKVLSVKTKLLGKLNILNIVGAIAVADKLGLSETEIQAGVRCLKTVPHRLALNQNANGSIIIDDAYNSNIKGAEMALEVLKNFEKRKRVLITPGIVDLGVRSDEINTKLGEMAADSSDYIILVGPKQAVPIMKGLQNKKYPQDKTFIAKNLNEALSQMSKVVDSKSVVLFENDLPDNYL